MKYCLCANIEYWSGGSNYIDMRRNVICFIIIKFVSLNCLEKSIDDFHYYPVHHLKIGLPEIRDLLCFCIARILLNSFTSASEKGRIICAQICLQENWFEKFFFLNFSPKICIWEEFIVCWSYKYGALRNYTQFMANFFYFQLFVWM